jgi:3-oxoacyl-[acyl-carrier protein] reductase
MAGEFTGKTAVITGASRGIGLALAFALAKRGCRLALCARDTSPLKQTTTELAKFGAEHVFAKPCDVRDERSVAAFFDTFRERFDSLDFLINNAGIAHQLAPVQHLDPKVWRNVVETNLYGLFLCTHYALPLMQAGGVIVNNLSVAAQGTFAGHSGYNSSKWGGLGFTNTLREELRDQRIRVIALIPGPTDTEIWKQFMPEAAHSSKMMPPEAIAQAVVDCLALPQNSVVEEIKIRPITGTI